MANIFKVLSLLLSYPEQEHCDAAPAMRAVVENEPALPAGQRKGLLALIDEIAERDLYDLQERYVLLFDRTRSLALHLFEHVHGESRDRGQAMVDLAALYERHGLTIDARELPDFLPLFLEFLSTRPREEACALLGQPLHVIAALRERLEKRASVYAAVFRTLESLAAAEPDAGMLKEVSAAPDDDADDLVALDEAWEDEPVTFGPDTGGGCGSIAQTLRRLGADLDRPRRGRRAESDNTR